MRSRVLVAAVLAALIPLGAHAERCALYGSCDSDDAYDYGNERTWRGSTDYRGNETWRDNRGTSVRGTREYDGSTTYRDNYGNVSRCREDYSGATVCREQPTRYGGLYE